MKNTSLNHTYRLVWNEALNAFVAVAEFARGKGKGGQRGTRLLATGLMATGMLGSAWAGGALPTGGNVVSGSGSIQQSGNALTVQQGSGKLVVDWNSFSIGQGNTVTFVQPSASAVALNRVLGSDVSVIQGALNANGMVFLVNPNGVLFTSTAQVNVGGLVASTQNIRNEDFLAGNYRFQGVSSNAIINQGNITAAPGGTIALIAAKVTNDGQLTANQGNVLLGAGSKVTLDMGGPVKLQIANDALETLISNGGAIKANGGTVWLTSQAANSLASSVINNTGRIEANSLGTNQNGEVILFAHGGTMNLGGEIQAQGGFVETSGKHFAIQPGAKVEAAKWLIDPVNITIDSTLAGTIATALGSGDVTITTDGNNTPSTNAGEAGTDGDITVDAAINWSAAFKLTLSAYRNILINQTITVDNPGGELALHYGQGSSASNNTADYSFGPNGSVSLPNGGKFTEKLGNDGLAVTSHFGRGAQVLPALTVNNTDSSVQNDGVQGPFLWQINAAGNHMFVMAPDGNDNLSAVGSQLSMSQDSIDYLNEVFDNDTTNFSYVYQTVELTAGQTVSRAWSYTSTDYDPYNDGSFMSFVNTSNPSDTGVKIYGLNNPVMVLGATVSGTGNWSTKSYGSTGWQTVTMQAGEAGTYKLSFGIFNLGDTSLSPYLVVGNVAGTTTLNGQPFAPIPVDPAGPLGSSGVVIGSPSAPAAPPSLAPAPTPTAPVEAAVSNVQTQPVDPITSTASGSQVVAPVTPPPTVVMSQQGSLPVFDLSGGLAFVRVTEGAAGGASGGAGGTTNNAMGGTGGTSGGSTGPVAGGTNGPANSQAPAGDTSTASADGKSTGTDSVTGLPTDVGGRDPFGFMRVFVVGGGVNMPAADQAGQQSGGTSVAPAANSTQDQRRNRAQ